MYSDITTCIDLWVPEQHNWRTDGLKWIVWGRAVSCYIIKHPISTQLTSCDGIHSHQVQWHYYCIDSVECQSSTTGGRMVSKWIVWGRAVSCLHNQAPNWNTIDFLRWNTLTSGTVTLLRVLILWVPEQHNWRTMAPNELYEGEQSHAYIIKHPLKHNWLLRWNTLTSGTVTLLRVLIVSAKAAQLEDGWSPNELYEGEQSHAYIIKPPNWNTIDFLRWNTLTSGTVKLLLVLILWVPEQHNWRTDGLQWIVWGRASHAYIIKHPIENTIDFLRWNTLTSGTVTLLRVLILWVPEQHNWRTDGLQMNCVRESSLMLT